MTTNRDSLLKRVYNFLLRQLDALIYGLIGPFSILYVFPQFLLKLEQKSGFQLQTPAFMDWVGTIFMWTGAGIAIWCGILLISTKNTISPLSSQSKVLTKGFYKIVRHPMMWSIHIVLIGEIFVYSSPILVIWFFLWLRLANIYVSRFEEPALISRFGNDYIEYCKVTPRWFPELKLWKTKKLNYK